jgi:hypothetical protein
MDYSIPCSIKRVPEELRIAAAAKATEINPINAPAMDALRHADPTAIIAPQHLTALITRYWGPKGVRLTVGFLQWLGQNQAAIAP